MAETRNSDIQKRILEETGLQASIEKIPNELTERILPVLVVNPKSRKKLLVKVDENTRGLISSSGKVIYVPAGKKWRILGGHLTLTTDATVGNRFLDFQGYTKDLHPSFYEQASCVQPASKTFYYNLIHNITPSNHLVNTTEFISFLIPDWEFVEGEGFYFMISALQAGDDAYFILYIEETDMLLEEVDYKEY